jgi:hypothetical protein
MTTMRFICILVGKDFSPSSFEDATGYRFVDKNEKGEIAKTGRYKNCPIPYGSATIRDEQNQENVLGFLEKSKNKLLNMGVESINLQLNVAYETQCNFELNADLLMCIAKLSIPLSVSCYESDSIE